jgi:hypothetical protein
MKNTHPVNIGHLVMGLAFAGIVGVWALTESGAVADDQVRWLLPVPWVLAGAAGLVVVALAGARRGRTSSDAGWVGETPDDTDTTDDTEEIR